MKGSFAYKTDKGLIRQKNEDNAISFINEDGDALLLVLDGMGGHQKGDVASQLALDYILSHFRLHKKFISFFSMKRWFAHIVKRANAYINRISETKIEYNDMGTTLVGIMIKGEHVTLINVGDSRAYLISKGKIKQISEDQTYVEFLYKSGKITEEEKKTHPKRHVLMNALGTYPTVSIAQKVIKEEFDYLLLCSDGLYNNVKDEKIKEIILGNGSLEEKCDRLIFAANDNGGPDNIAVNIWEVKR